MENEISNIISYMKNVSKKRVTGKIIESELRRKDLLTNEIKFETVIDSLVNINVLVLCGGDSSKI